MHENQGVTCTAQDQDDYVMSEDKCHGLLYKKLCYCLTAGEHQYHINALPDQYMGYVWLRQVNAAQCNTCISSLVTMIL